VSATRLRGSGIRPGFLLFLAARINLRMHPAATTLAILAVAASAALVSALEIASRGVREELDRTAKAIVGRADLEVVATKRGVAEDLVEKVAAVPGVFAASPVMIETVRLREPLRGVAVRVLGVDLLAEAQIRDYHVTENRVEIRDPLRLLASPNAVIIPELLADRLGVREHDTFTVRTPLREETFIVKGLLAKGGLADAYGGYIAIMDVWNLQHLLDAQGWVDKIEVTLAEGVDPAGAIAALEPALRDSAIVRQISNRPDVVAAIIGTVDLAAWFINAISACVAALLAYSAVAYIVEGRVRDLSAMQCAGLDTLAVGALVLVDSLLIAGVGAFIGLAIGIELAPRLLRSFSTFSELYQSVVIDQIHAEPQTLFLVVALAALIGLLGGLAPSLRVLRRQPLDALDSERTPTTLPLADKRRALWGAAALAISILFGMVAGAPPLLRLGMTFGGTLGALLICGAPMMLLCVPQLRGSLFSYLMFTPLLGVSFLARPTATGVGLASIAALVAALISILSTVDSLTTDLGEWSASSVKDGASVTPDPGVPSAIAQEQLISQPTIEMIRSTPGVEDVAVFYASTVPYQGAQIELSAFDAEILARRGALDSWRLPSSTLAAALLSGGIVISDRFRRRFGIEEGEAIVLPTRVGPRELQVVGVVPSYSGPDGALGLDVRTFDSLFARTGAHFLTFWSSVDEREMFTELARRTADLQPLIFREEEAVRGAARTRVDHFRGLLAGLAALCGLFGGIALLSLLVGTVVGQRRGLSTALVVGATPNQIALTVLADGLIVAGAACTIGAISGTLSGAALSDLLFERMGWVIRYHVRPQIVVVPMSLVVVVLLASSIVASVVVRRLPRSIDLPPPNSA
jgi:putative ABC transport system permease protein